MGQDKRLRTGQVADLLHVSPKSVTRYADREGLPFEETPGGHRRYLFEEVLAWVAGREAQRQALRDGARERLHPRSHGRSEPEPTTTSTTPAPAQGLNGSGP